MDGNKFLEWLLERVAIFGTGYSKGRRDEKKSSKDKSDANRSAIGRLWRKHIARSK